MNLECVWKNFCADSISWLSVTRRIKFLHVCAENMPDFGYAELFPEKSRNPHPEIKSSVPVEKVILSHFYTSVGRGFCVPFVYQMCTIKNPTTILLV